MKTFKKGDRVLVIAHPLKKEPRDVCCPGTVGTVKDIYVGSSGKLRHVLDVKCKRGHNLKVIPECLCLIKGDIKLSYEKEKEHAKISLAV